MGIDELVDGGGGVNVDGGIEVTTTLEEVTTEVEVAVEEGRVLVTVRTEVVRLTV